MDAAGTSNWVRPARPFDSTRLLRTAVALGMALLALAGGMLVARRLSGALAVPPSGASFTIVGVLLASAGLGFRRTFVEATQPRRVSLALMLLPSAVSVLWLAALSLPLTSGWGLVLLFGPVLLAEGWSWGRLPRKATPHLPVYAAIAPQPAPVMASPSSVAEVAPPTMKAVTAPPSAIAPPAASAFASQASAEVSADAACEASDEELAEPAERDENALQQQTRRRDEEAGEVVDGWVRVDFAAGQRHAAAHIAICPPLHGKPICYAEPGEGPDASVKITQAMSYGVRLEVRLAEAAAEPASVIVEYTIRAHEGSTEMAGESACPAGDRQ